MPASRFQCTCGFMIDVTPQIGDSVVSAYHLHKGPRLDGGSSIIRMEESPDPVPERELACAGASREQHRAAFPVEAPHHQPREKTPRPHRRAA